MMIKAPPHKSSLAELDGNVLAVLVYVIAYVMLWLPYVSYFAWAGPLIVYLMEKRSPFVKFHAMQALILSVIHLLVGIVVSIILGLITVAAIAATQSPFGLSGLILIPVVTFLVNAAFTVFAVIAAVNAYKYNEYEIPLVGKLARKWGKF